MNTSNSQNRNSLIPQEQTSEDDPSRLPDYHFKGVEVFLPPESIARKNGIKTPNFGICTNKLCGKYLVPPYYIFFSHSPVEWVRKCMSIKDEEKRVLQLRDVIYTMTHIHTKNKRQADHLVRQIEKFKQRYCEICYYEYNNALQIIRQLRELEDDNTSEGIILGNCASLKITNECTCYMMR